MLSRIISKSPIIRFVYFKISLIMVKILIRMGKYYDGAYVFCRNYRVLRHLAILSCNDNDTKCLICYDNYFEYIINNLVKKNNLVYKSFIKSKDATVYRKFFLNLSSDNCVRLKYPRVDDFQERQGDLMILKAWNPGSNEKGVIALHYTETLAKFASIYDLQNISRHYRIILEPSWWGYQNVYMLFYLNLPTDVIIESPDMDDYKFIEKTNNNFTATRIGAGDWVDGNMFIDGKDQDKLYDIVMVGNWSKIKRHEILFNALSMNKEINNYKIALIGYPSHGRTKKDILAEANKHGIYENVTIFENITADKVAEILRQSKVNVLLSKGEGANRGIYEGMFSGNVIVLYKDNRGVNKLNINEETGVLANVEELPTVLKKSISNYKNYNSASWAKNNIGAYNSSKKMNDIIKNIAIDNGEAWTTDIAYKMNRPNNLYYMDSDRKKLESEYNNLKKYLLKI